MHTSCENSTKGNPQEHNRSPQSSGQGTKDRAEACDVEELYKEQLPLRKDHVVNAVIEADSRCFPVIGSKGVCNYLAIYKIAADQ